jgi:hypothetical protein
MDHRGSGPSWTGLHCRPEELIGARPPATPVPRELRPRGRGEEGRAGELNGGVAAAREVVEGRLTSGGASARKGDGENALRAKRKSVGGVGVFTEGGADFYRAEARRGRPSAFNGRR